MANITTAAAGLMLDHFLGVTDSPFSTTVYVGLSTTDPTIAGLLTGEVSGESYARQAVDFDAAVAGSNDNTAQITFPEATGNWGTPAYWILCTALAAGTVLYYGALAPGMNITAGMQYIIPAGTLDIYIPLT